MTVRTWVLSVAAVIAGWFAIQIAAMVVTDAAPGAVVLFPRAGFVAQLPIGVAIVGAGPY